MAKLNTLHKSTTHSVMIYGAPLTGKSLLAGKLSEYFNLIWVDMENGHDVLFQLPEPWQERIELIAIPDTTSYPMAIETVLKMVKGGKHSICVAHGKVSCQLCKREESEIMKADNSANAHKQLFTDVDFNNLLQDTIVVFDSSTQLTSSAIANITKNKPDDYKLDWDDWGALGKLMEIFFSHIQNAPYNCIVISHEIEADQEDGKKVLVPVGGTRNFSRNVAKFFDHVVYAQKKNKKHVFSSSTTYQNNIVCGSRSGVELEASEEASLLAIFKPEVVPTSLAISGVDKKQILATSSSVGVGARDTKAVLAGIKKKI